MSLQGLPDFQQVIQADPTDPTDDINLFYPYEGAGQYSLLPTGLEIAKQADGRPDFELEIVRGVRPDKLPVPYGVLNFRVSPVYKMAEALAVVSDRTPKRPINPIIFSGTGFLRFQLVGNVTNIPKGLLAPIPIAWNGLGTARFNLRISEGDSALLSEVLQAHEGLTFNSAVEQEFVGVSPRLPLKVSFDPAALLTELIALGADQTEELSETPSKQAQPIVKSVVARARIEAYFRKDLDDLPITIEGDITEDKQAFSEAMTDRVRVRFGRFTPATSLTEGPCMALSSASEVGRGRFEWNLAEPMRSPRPLFIILNPLSAAQQLVERQGIESVVHYTTVPNISTGFQRVSVIANLPPLPKGLLDIGVTLRVAAKFPYRPQAQVRTERLKPDQSNLTIDLRFLPREEPEYTAFTYVVMRDAKGIQQIKGEKTVHQGDRLYLSPRDFPIRFLSVKADRALLEIAEIKVLLSRPDGEDTIEELAILKMAEPQASFVVTKDDEAAMMMVEAIAHAGTGKLLLGPVVALSLQLGLHSFKEANAQKVDITCKFESDDSFALFEFLPESSAEALSDIELMSFTPDRPTGELIWLPSSPFQYRYRYRRKSLAANAEPTDWSAYLSPFEPLIIHA